MGGIIGAVSGKLVLGAVALLFSVKINEREVLAAIDGDAPTSAISVRLADRLHIAPSDPNGSAPAPTTRLWLRFNGGMFRVALPVVNKLPGSADVRLGQDILAAHMLRLDFRHRTGGLVLRDRLVAETRNMTSITIDTASDGTVLLPVRMGDGTTARARLQFNFHDEMDDGNKEKSVLPIAILGDNDATVVEVNDYHVDGEGRASKVFIDLLTFQDRVILLDLRNRRLWVSSKKTTA